MPIPMMIVMIMSMLVMQLPIEVAHQMLLPTLSITNAYILSSTQLNFDICPRPDPRLIPPATPEQPPTYIPIIPNARSVGETMK
jgi:hypothetical protein